MTRARPASRKKATALEKTDIAVAEAIAPAHRHPAVQALGEISDFGDQPPLYAAAAGVIAAGLALGDARTLRAGSRILAAHVVAIALKNLVKRSVDRTRPHLAVDQGHYESGKGERFEGDYNSFPSGHTASSIAFARALGREYPDQGNAALAAAAAVSLIQIPRGTHYVSDVAAGALVGLAAEALVDRAFRRFHPDLP